MYASNKQAPVSLPRVNGIRHRSQIFFKGNEEKRCRPENEEEDWKVIPKKIIIKIVPES